MSAVQLFGGECGIPLPRVRERDGRSRSLIRSDLSELRNVDPELASLRNLNRPEDYLQALATAGFAPDPEVLAGLRASGSTNQP